VLSPGALTLSLGSTSRSWVVVTSLRWLTAGDGVAPRISLALLRILLCLSAAGEISRFASISNVLSTKSRNSVGLVSGFKGLRFPPANYFVVSLMPLAEKMRNMEGILEEKVQLWV